jgi:hypothetical protein
MDRGEVKLMAASIERTARPSRSNREFIGTPKAGREPSRHSSDAYAAGVSDERCWR